VVACTQDVCLAEKDHVNAAMLLDAGCGIIQTAAARPGMMTKDRFDEKSMSGRFENPLPVRDVTFAKRDLVIEDEAGTPYRRAVQYTSVRVVLGVKI